MIGSEEDGNRLSDHLFGRITIQSLGAVVPTNDDSVHRLAHDGVYGEFYNRRQPCPVILEGLLLGNIPHEPGKKWLPFAFNWSNCQFAQEFVAVCSAGGHFQSLVQNWAFAGGEEVGKALSVALPHSRRDDELAHFLANH